MVLVMIVIMENLGERQRGAGADHPLLHFYASASTMVDGAAEDEDGDGDDALRTLSDSRKRAPYLARQRCCGISASTYGIGWPLAGSAGGRRIAQRAD